jgi:hypothetical protein
MKVILYDCARAERKSRCSGFFTVSYPGASCTTNVARTLSRLPFRAARRCAQSALTDATILVARLHVFDSRSSRPISLQTEAVSRNSRGYGKLRTPEPLIVLL